MVTVEEARELIRACCRPLSPIKVELESALGHTLAEDIYAQIDIPNYPQSGMDGYAFSFDAWHPESPLEVIGEIAAGDKNTPLVLQGKAVRIFTGAPVPAGTNTVVMQEKIRRDGNQIFIESPGLKQGDNVRPAGSEIRAGALALPAGSPLTPAAIGFLAGLGNTEIRIHPSPRIALLITGNELQEPGHPLEYGQVYESNSIALKAALARYGLTISKQYRIKDDLDKLKELLADALENHDLILITGGISVGDYDYTLSAAQACEVEQVFHKIRQKPGKPLYIGKKQEKIIMALPGNPASVLTCFYEYGTELLSLLMKKELKPEVKKVPVAGSYSKAPGLTVFLKGWFNGEQVELLPAQESYKLSSFALANCLAVLPEESTGIKEGDFVEIHLTS